MKPPNKLLRALGFRRMLIKPKAHVFTVLSVCWSVFSALGLLIFSEARRHEIGSEALRIALVIWGLHLLFIALAVYFWAREKKRKVTVFRA
jgi:hypothetical protein